MITSAFSMAADRTSSVITSEATFAWVPNERSVANSVNIGASISNSFSSAIRLSQARVFMSNDVIRSID
jgi:hypothetical protein